MSIESTTDESALPPTSSSMPADWNLFLSNLGEDAGEPKGFWRLKDAVTEAEFALGAGLVNTAVITRASNR